MAIMNGLSGHAVIGSKTLTGGKHETLLENTLYQYIILYSHGTWRPRTVDKQDKKVVSSRGSETLDLTKVERNSTGKLKPQQISTIFPRTPHTRAGRGSLTADLSILVPTLPPFPGIIHDIEDLALGEGYLVRVVGGRCVGVQCPDATRTQGDQ